jgi:hypothetical protein
LPQYHVIRRKKKRKYKVREKRRGMTVFFPRQDEVNESMRNDTLAQKYSGPMNEEKILSST